MPRGGRRPNSTQTGMTEWAGSCSVQPVVSAGSAPDGAVSLTPPLLRIAESCFILVLPVARHV